MRLDKYLKVSRIIKRRTVAKEVCDGGRASINGRAAKAGTEIKPGDILEIRFGGNLFKAEILSVIDNVKKEDAAGMYKIITSEGSLE